MGKQKEHKERPKINNFNPYNKLSLNKYHQLKDQTQKVSLNKKKRDIQRLLKYKKEKGEEVVQSKIKQLDGINEKLSEKKKVSERQSRKQRFLRMKYQKIMDVEMTKVKRKLKSLKKTQADPEQSQQYKQWIRKLNYIKHFPKNLKYVSLFPSNKPLQPEAIAFQNKLINDINKELEQQNEKLNKFGDENSGSKKKSKKDAFFVVAQQSQQVQKQSMGKSKQMREQQEEEEEEDNEEGEEDNEEDNEEDEKDENLQ